MPDEDLNITNFAAEIAGELTAPPLQENVGGDESTEGVAVSSTQTPPASAPDTNPTPTFAQMPQSWKKEMSPHWQGLSKEVQDYILQRDSEYARGVSSYKSGHDNWNQLFSPFQQVLSQNPGVNPLQLAQQVLMGHVALSQSPPEQKLQLALKMLQHYGIDPKALLAGQPDPTAERLRALEQSLYQDKLEKTTAHVNSFFADSKNKYAKDLEGDILSLIQNQKANTLEEAYEMALWLNPATREKVIADQMKAAEKAAEEEAAKQLASDRLNVGRRDNARAPQGKPKSINDTIDSVIEKHYGKH